MDVVALTRELIRCASVTPDDAGCQPLLIEHLKRLGFTITTLPFGNVSNFWARRGDAAPLLAFAGHTDVVPSGPVEQWHTPPFEPALRDDCLYGRGAADMKSALAAMIAAIDAFVARVPEHAGSIGMLVTSDEEGDAVDGTVKVMDHLSRHGTRIDYCVVGEPSSQDAFGDTVRVGRRGSLNGRIVVRGVQGHVAYPDRVVNPVHLAAPVLVELTTRRWDDGNDYFPATSFQISNAQAGTGADNVVPGTLELKCNFRFNTAQTPERLTREVEAVFHRHGVPAEFRWTVSGLPFLTEQGRLIEAVSNSVARVTGRTPLLSTAGGTSDGRFIAPTGSEVVEVGVVNRTIHQIDEHVRTDDIAQLAEVYRLIVVELLGQ